MQEFITKTAERAAKTFAQFFFANWILLSGKAADFDHLFTASNLKAGVVGVALSIATSLGSKGIGPDTDSPSVV